LLFELLSKYFLDANIKDGKNVRAAQALTPIVSAINQPKRCSGIIFDHIRMINPRATVKALITMAFPVVSRVFSKAGSSSFRSFNSVLKREEK